MTQQTPGSLIRISLEVGYVSALGSGFGRLLSHITLKKITKDHVGGAARESYSGLTPLNQVLPLF
ncbi:hypothetical protein [Synechococcus sp. CC9311]|uniref:hypothetical protein n=1 Tax=Synechococcus sp. (strain CC9311) TaxID=64471 RepID=UPI001439A5F3|nr:hypothetical protein [Synechococcus sp. CC9311]